tara:strand:- start:1767 stop:3650 length:1884 start_codon:yes stop_codon:yes gene_type:complete
MANKSVSKNEVYLNGVYYPVTRPVQTVLSSLYPPKVTIGDTTRDSQTRASVVSWSDFSGGIGIERMEGSTDVDRAWWSNLSLRYKRHLVLGPESVQTTNSSATSAYALDIIQEFNGDIYGIWSDQKVYKFNSGYGSASDAFGSALDTLPNRATDALEVRMGGTLYLVIAHTGGYTYTSGDASSYTDSTRDTKYLAWWDEKLWGIDNAGQLWYATTIGTEALDAKLPLPDGYVTDLFVARNANGDPILYAMTKTGLYAHDFANGRWVETQLALPFHNDNGKGSVRWRDSVYIPAGLGIYKYINGTNSAVISVVGPDRDHGLPADERGSINKLLGTHNDLLAFVDGTTPAGMGDMFPSTPQSDTIASSTGYSTILGWNETGWEAKWVASDQGERITAAYVADVGGGISTTDSYRLYWGHNGYMYYMQLHPDIINPTQIETFNYASTGTHFTPWFSANQVEIDKLALKLKVETEGCSSSETVAVSYATDYGTTYTSLGTITSNGLTTYTFGSSLGTAFRSIQFKLVLSRGSTNTNSPDVISTTFEYRKKLETKFGWQVNVNMNKTYKGKTPKALRSNVLSAIDSNTLLEFTFRDDSGGTRNYYVDIINAQGLENTGYDERGSTQLLLQEP